MRHREGLYVDATMNSRRLGAAILAALALPVWAEEPVAQFDALAPIHSLPHWNDPALWEKHLRPKSTASTIALGKSDFVIRGPLVDALRPVRRPVQSERSLGQKLMSLPIMNLFVPQPMPVPPGGDRKYFVWGERAVSWAEQADRDVHGPQCALISVSR